MATQELSFDDLWIRYMGAHVTPAEWAAAGWDMARILDDLRDAGLTGPAMMDIANGIAAGLEELGYPLTHELDALTLTTAHAASSYGRPVLVIEGEAYGPGDMTPAGVTGVELVNDWAARFIGQAAGGDLRGLLRDLWAGAMIGKDGAGFVQVSPTITGRVVAALRES